LASSLLNGTDIEYQLLITICTMDSGNLLGIISKLISFNKEERKSPSFAQFNASITKIVIPNFQDIEKEQSVIPVTRQLALEQIRNVN
jgi:uncharacterized membrane protein